MNALRSWLKRHNTFVLSIGFLVVFSVSVSYAVPPTSPYTAGETLDPSCAPGTSNCTVAVSTGGAQWDDVTGGINYAGGRVGIGTTTPTVALDVVGAMNTTLDSSIHGVQVGLGGGSIATNTALGLSALSGNTTGGLNTAIGYQTLSANDAGVQNTAVGYQALMNNTGNYNTALGRWALLTNTTGTLNTAVGLNAMRFNTTGFGNTAVGLNSLTSNINGQSNSAFGSGSLQLNTGGLYNVAVGSSTLFSNLTGSYNVGLGIRALYSNTGSYNIALGAGVDVPSNSGSGQLNIGNVLYGTGLYEGGLTPSSAPTVAGRIGIGTTTPQSTLDVNGQIQGKNLNITGTTGSSLAAPTNLNPNIIYDPSYAYSPAATDFGYTVYAYRIVNGVKMFSGPSGGSYTNSVGPDNYAVQLSWNAVSGADGYRVFPSRTGYYSGIDYAYDTAATSIIDGDGSMSFSNDPADVTVNPQYASYSNTNTINGLLSVAGNITTDRDISARNADFTGNIIASGIAGTTVPVPDLGAGTRMMWIPSNGSFRAGTTNDTEWDSANVGQYSAAFGVGTTASGTASFAFGGSTTASGNNSFAGGGGATASGSLAFAFGGGAHATGDYSVSFTGTQASGNTSFAFGGGSSATNTVSVAIGQGVHSTGTYALAIGVGTTASGAGSFVGGGGSTATGDYSFAFGTSTHATNINAFALGNLNTALGAYSMALGNQTIASGDFSTAFGNTTAAYGDYSTAFGSNTKADSYGSIALGQYNVGGGTEDSWIDTESLFEIGNGTSSGNRANAFTLLKNGHLGLNTATPRAALDIAGDGSIIATGTQGSGIPVPDLGEGARMMWIPSAGAFRAGYGYDTAWDAANVGVYSTAFGAATTASGTASVAFGIGTKASGNYSVSFGSGTTASGDYAVAFGLNNTAPGIGATAFGFYTNASSQYSTVIGRYNVGGGTAGDWIDTDPVFEIGNGFSSDVVGRANALTVLKNGNVGIQTATPGFLLEVGNGNTGSIVARFHNSSGTCDINPTSSSLDCSSDMKLKKKEELLSDGSPWNFNSNISFDNQTVLGKVLALRPVQYNWNSESDTATKHPGFIAQEVEQIFPALVATDPDTGLKSLNYTGMIPYTVQAIQDMNFNITKLDDLDRPNTWRESLIAWFGSATNGIKSLVVQDKVCINETCVTEAQLKQLLNQQNTNGGGGSTTTVTNPPAKEEIKDTPPADEKEDAPEEKQEEVIDTADDTQAPVEIPAEPVTPPADPVVPTEPAAE